MADANLYVLGNDVYAYQEKVATILAPIGVMRDLFEEILKTGSTQDEIDEARDKAVKDALDECIATGEGEQEEAVLSAKIELAETVTATLEAELGRMVENGHFPQEWKKTVMDAIARDFQTVGVGNAPVPAPQPQIRKRTRTVTPKKAAYSTEPVGTTVRHRVRKNISRS